jgi:UDP:flavonoid glycosyltransferase YjiC (YdhE family)
VFPPYTNELIRREWSTIRNLKYLRVLLLFQIKKLENSEIRILERNLLLTNFVYQNLYSKQPLKLVADSVPTHPGLSTIDVPALCINNNNENVHEIPSTGIHRILAKNKAKKTKMKMRREYERIRGKSMICQGMLLVMSLVACDSVREIVVEAR